MTTFNQLVAYAPSYGPEPAGFAGYGFTDFGSHFSIVGSGSSGALVNSSLSGGNAALTGLMLRQAASEQCVTQRLQCRYYYTDANNPNLWFFFRFNGAPSGSPTAIQVNNVGQIAGYINGAGQSAGGGTLPNDSASTYYDIQIDVVQTNGATTTITATKWSVTSTSAAFGSGTQMGTNTSTTTTAAYQNLSGSMGFFWYTSSQSASGRNIVLFNTFSGDTVNAATAYNFSGPPGGYAGLTSAPIYVQAAGSIAAADTVTLSDGGNGGTFSPTSVTLAAGNFPAATATYTPASTGTKSLSATNTGGLTNPAAQSFAATVAPITVAVNNAGLVFSPGNWSGDNGQTGTTFMRAWANGASLKLNLMASASPTATLLIASSSASNTISVFVNGVLSYGLAGNGNIALSGLVANSTNLIEVYLDGSAQSSRWNGGTNSVRFLGIQIDGNSSIGAAPTPANRPWIPLYGDSNSEGIEANNGNNSNLYNYTWSLMKALDNMGYDLCLDACGYSGWTWPGDSGGDVPALYKTSSGTYNDAASRWNKVDQGVSRLDANGKLSSRGALNTPPSAIIINMISNDCGNAVATSDVINSVQQGIAAMRVASGPNVPIILIMTPALYCAASYPTGPTYLAALRTGISQYQAANPADTRVHIIDPGQAFSNIISNPPYVNSDQKHNLILGHAQLGALVAGRTASLMASDASQRTPNYY